MHAQIIHRVIPFALTFTFSILVGLALPSFFNREEPPKSPNGIDSAQGRSEVFPAATISTIRGPNSPLRITFQPKARYTDEARTGNIEGAVRLKITLLADGTVGDITTVTGLPHGLTEMAIAAARRIKFEPKMVNDEPVSVVITREYTFTIY